MINKHGIIIFRNQVTMHINEDIFKSLYTTGAGSPNTPIRILIAWFVLKETERLSDQKYFFDIYSGFG